VKRTHIVVVDDDLAVRDALKFALETEGLSAETCASGRQLLDSGALSRADCLVLDCKMPDLDGFAVIAELEARKVTLPVILMTVPVTDAVQRRARAAGAFSLLEKPLLNGVLTDNIRRATGA